MFFPKIQVKFSNFIIEEELDLHSTVFHWPKQMSETFEQNLRRLQLKREQAEEKLEEDKKEFEQNLFEYIEKLEAYKTKDSPYLDMEEMREHSVALTDLNDKITACVQAAAVWNSTDYIFLL